MQFYLDLRLTSYLMERAFRISTQWLQPILMEADNVQEWENTWNCFTGNCTFSAEV